MEETLTIVVFVVTATWCGARCVSEVLLHTHHFNTLSMKESTFQRNTHLRKTKSDNLRETFI